MKRSRLVTCGAGVIVTLLACNADIRDRAADGKTVEESAGITIVHNARPVWNDTVRVVGGPSLEIGASSPGAEYELFRVAGAVRLSDGRVVVANGGTSELRWYNPEGVYLSRSGGPGEGPGEFLGLLRVVGLPGDSLMIVDARLRRYTILSPDGELMRTGRVESRINLPLPIARLEDQTILMASGSALALGAQGPPRIERIPLEVLGFTEGSSEPKFVEFFPGLEVTIGPSGGIASDGSVPIGRRPRPFGRNTLVAGDRHGWVVANNDEPQFEIRSPEGEVIAIAAWPHRPRLVTSDDLAADRAPTLERLADPVARNRMLEAWAQHPEPPDAMPVFSSVLLDELGNVWVQEYSPWFEPVSNRFRIFDRSGTWLGLIIGPEDSRILAVGDGWLLALRRDALDLETVALYEFELPVT